MDLLHWCSIWNTSLAGCRFIQHEWYNPSVVINRDGQKFNHYLDKLILDEAKREGRKRNLEEQQNNAASRDNNFSKLTSYTSVTPSSGTLAKHNIYELGEGRLAKVKEKEDMTASKKQRIGAKKLEQKEKSSVRFKTAFEKYRQGETLTRDNLVALINKTKLTNDPPNGKNLRDLAQQWNERKHRLDEYLGDILVQDIHPAIDTECLIPNDFPIDDATMAINL
jgi:hypothetical protein